MQHHTGHSWNWRKTAQQGVLSHLKVHLLVPAFGTSIRDLARDLQNPSLLVSAIRLHWDSFGHFVLNVEE